MLRVMIDNANQAGDQWAAWVVGNSLETAVLLVLISVLWRAIRRRVAPQVGYCLFLLIPIKLLVPIVVTVPSSLAIWTPAALARSWLEQEHEVPPIVAVRVENAVEPIPKFEPKSAMPMVPAESPAHVSLAPVSPERPVAKLPALSTLAIVMLAWLASISILFIRLIQKQFLFRAYLKGVNPLNVSTLPVDWVDLTHRSGVTRAVRLVEDDTIAAPAVWGIIRPTIVLPRGISATLAPEQLRWVLLHELAHIQRGDLLVVAFQRIAVILHFFNPLIWVANPMINRLREYACDDIATSLSETSPVESSEAFLSVLRHADRSRKRLEGALGIFGLDSRAACFGRIRRLLDTDRPIRTKLGVRSVIGLILLAIVALPSLRAGSPPPQAPAAPPVVAKPPEATKEFELRLVGPDQKPVAGAEVIFDAELAPSAEPIHRGTFIKKGKLWTTIKADSEGRVTLAVPVATTSLWAMVRTPGFGPYSASWSPQGKNGPLPAQFTAELDAAWSVGGIVVDEKGQPIPGVTVHPHLEFKKPPGDTSQMGSGSVVTTDAAGKWRFECVPNQISTASVGLNHPEFSRSDQRLPRVKFGLASGAEPSAKITLKRGLVVTGKVTDTAGKPIVGALIRTKFHNDKREAKTGEDGTYKLVGCEPKTVRIVVSAPGKAFDLKQVTIEPGMGPVDFVMQPGGTLRIRFVDAQGKPVPNSRIFPQNWRGHVDYFEFDHVPRKADENGVWVWNEAPLDEIQADIVPGGEGGMQLPYQPIIARKEEYVFKFPPMLVISGKVFDADTKAPIKTFRVTPGDRLAQDRLFWLEQNAFNAKDGTFEYSTEHITKVLAIRVDADGYKTQISREFQIGDGAVTYDFAMTRAANLAAKVVTPDGKPAADAQVVLAIPGTQTMIVNGEIPGARPQATRRKTDDAGAFHFPAQDGEFQVIVTHPSGFARVKSASRWNADRVITLEPWAKVEGTFHIGKKLMPGVPIEIQVNNTAMFGEARPTIFSEHRAMTNAEGKFVFPRVIPGTGVIGRHITFMSDEGATEATSSYMVAAGFPSGKTTVINLGGTGRAVVGKLEASAKFKEKPRWKFARMVVKSETIQADDNRSAYTVSASADGTFRIDDIPPGAYLINMGPMFGRDGKDVGKVNLFNYRFVVPPATANDADTPVDLGTITLNPPQN